IWLAAAFAEYEHVIALENALRREASDSESSARTAKKGKSKAKPSQSKGDSSPEKQAKASASSAGSLSDAARDLVDLALFRHESRWLAARQRLGHDLPLREIRSDDANNEWYEIAVGKGVMLLAALRKNVGADTFDRLMDEFGQAHAGREVTTEEFVE